MIGGNSAPHVPWQAMVYLSEDVLDGGYAGGALISDRWVLTAGRNLFVNKSRQDNQGKGPVIPKVYLGITQKSDANPTNEVSVEKVREKNIWWRLNVHCNRLKAKQKQVQTFEKLNQNNTNPTFKSE